MPTTFRVEELLEALPGRLLRGQARGSVTGISTDTRTLQPGQAYLAIPGPRFDGHAFVRDAASRGATAVIVDRTKYPELSAALEVPVIGVAEPLRAYGALAAWHRRRFRIPIVAITGSCGKTTTKEYLTTLLGDGGPVLKNPKTENNAVGVPRALLQLTDRHTAAVLELGSNHPGEIAYLRDLAAPTHAVVLNIGPAHLEFFGTVDDVAAEKLSLLEGLPDDGGIVLNADDPRIQRWLTDRRQDKTLPAVATFGSAPTADLWAQDAQWADGHTQFLVNGRYAARLPALGTHHVQDALAALAMAQQLGRPLEALIARLNACRSLEWRMELLRLPGGPTLLCDCYNANPLSMAQAIRTLAAYPHAKRRILVAGSMHELGSATTPAHCNVGKWAMEAGLDGVIAIGPYASLVLAGAQSMMRRVAVLMAYQTVEEACARVPELLGAQDAVLIKGSRGAHLEHLVTRCQERWPHHLVGAAYGSPC